MLGERVREDVGDEEDDEARDGRGEHVLDALGVILGDGHERGEDDEAVDRGR